VLWLLLVVSYRPFSVGTISHALLSSLYATGAPRS